MDTALTGNGRKAKWKDGDVGGGGRRPGKWVKMGLSPRESLRDSLLGGWMDERMWLLRLGPGPTPQTMLAGTVIPHILRL